LNHTNSSLERSGIDLYFITEDDDEKKPFKSTILYRPYFYIIPDIDHIIKSSSTTSSTSSSSLSYTYGKDTTKSTKDDTDNTQLPILYELFISHLHRLYESFGLYMVEIVYKQDLDQFNHLSPNYNTNNNNNTGRPILKLSFNTTTQLITVRDAILKDIIHKNQSRQHQNNHNTISYENISSFSNTNSTTNTSSSSTTIFDEPLQYLIELREYDVPYLVRVCTDLDIRAGTWYTVQLFNDNEMNDSTNKLQLQNTNNTRTITTSNNTIQQPQLPDYSGVRLLEPDRESKANPVVLAFDIECTKAPLKFPSAEYDEIFMISYMVSSSSAANHNNGNNSNTPQGYLIVSRSIVSQDISDFDYTPQTNYPGPFHIYNEINEEQLLRRFFSEFRKHGPQIVVTYNGDFFDFPYIDTRAKIYGMNLYREIGIEQIGGSNMNNNRKTTTTNDSNDSSNSKYNNNNNSGGTYRGRCVVHLDAFHWVQRDSYLPQGAQGLKAVTKYKLGYDPVEVDPEDMVRYAQEKPIYMATYSVSDAVATFYLYEKYVHLFIFSLCTIIPMGPEDVLGKGSGTLCEALLMVQACKKNIICPNKHTDDLTKFHNGHLLESETYIGGKVECLETGVYRSDLEYEFQLQPEAFQQLIDHIDRDLTFTIETENHKQRIDVTNYNEVNSFSIMQNVVYISKTCGLDSHSLRYLFFTILHEFC
jgi:DNA polymerase epsilon subunit 1